MMQDYMAGSAAGFRPSRSSAPIRVLIADDHPVIVWGLRQMIETDPHRMQVMGTAESCERLLAHPALDEVDVLLLDLNLHGLNSLDVLPSLVADRGMKVVILTGDLNPRCHQDAVMRGARGVVLKGDPSDDILNAIERVHAGEVWLDGSLMAKLLCGLAGGGAAGKAAPQDEHAKRIASLTTKERQVIAALVKHRGVKSLVVAEALGISEHTLRNHLTVIYSKLQVQGKLNLYVYAMEHGLADTGVARGDRRTAAGTPPSMRS